MKVGARGSQKGGVEFGVAEQRISVFLHSSAGGGTGAWQPTGAEAVDQCFAPHRHGMFASSLTERVACLL